jgi:hypothetical protein
MPSDGKGAKGNDVMTRTHAAGSAMSYGMRYLLKAIFNIAIGEDDDGNAAGRALPRITAEQAANIHALMEEVQANTHAFMRYWKIDSVEGIPAQAYKDVVASLERKRKK